MTKYRNYQKTHTLTMQGHQMKRRIARNRSRATLVGFLYLIGTIALAAIAALVPFFVNELAPAGVSNILETFQNMDISTVDGLVKTINAVLYMLMFVGTVVNVIKALSKLGWLCKKSATENLGLNRNVYAMEDMGRAFSGSIALLFCVYFLMAIISGDGMSAIDSIIGTLNGTLNAGSSTYLALILILVFIILHILIGFIGAKISYFNIENGQIVEHKRIVGRFAPIVRNAVQLVGMVVLVCFFLQSNTLHAAITTLLAENGIETFMGDQNALMAAILQVVIVISLLVLIKHATATTEYAINGVRSSGMKNFRVFAFFVFVAAAAAAFIVQYDAIEAFQVNHIIMAVVALVLFIVELVMRKFPKFPEEKHVKGVERYSDEVEFTLDSLPQFTHPFDYNN